MMKRFLIFFSFVGVFAFYSKPAKADIEALQAVITYVGDVLASAKEEVSKAQGMMESVKQLKTQVKSAVDDVKKTVDQAKGAVEEVKNTVQTAKEKAEAIKEKVNNTVSAVKNKDINALKDGLPNMEFSSLNGTFDGTKDDDEMADAVLETMVRKKGADSIANQKALSDAMNQRNGKSMANMFAKTMTLRQDLMEEKDEKENPETIDEAISLQQKMRLSAMRRRNKILNMEATMSEFHYAQEMENVQGEYEETKDE